MVSREAEVFRLWGGEQVYRQQGDSINAGRLGGIGGSVADHIARICEVEARVTVLGHLQRGGSPTAFDRFLATRYGAAAVRFAARGDFGRMIALENGEITDVSLEEALAVPKHVDVQGDAVITAQGLGIAFGDER